MSRVRSISAYAHTNAYITSEAIYLSHPASESLTSAKTAWWASIKTVNHETHNNHEVEGSRPRGPVQPSFWFCRRAASCRASPIFVSRPHAMRVGLKLSSALRAPRRARWRRPRHRGSSFSFPHPPSPQDTHRIYLVRHPAISIIFPPGSIFSNSGTYGSTFPSPYPICGHRARSRAFVVSSLRISSIPSAIVRPPGVVVLLPVAHSPCVNHTGRAVAHILAILSKPL